jgi:hypothetical protein
MAGRFDRSSGYCDGADEEGNRSMSEETKSGGPAEGSEPHGGRRWLMVGVVVPITVALIGAMTVVVQNWSKNETSAGAPTVEALPAGDPIPAAWCFDCNPQLIAVARDCREGSMTACDDLWKTVADPKVAEPGAIHDYGVSCGGRRQLKSPGYQYKDCTDAFPGHN